MKYGVVIAGLVTALTVGAGASFAQGPGIGDRYDRHDRPAFEDLDADKSGEITQAELQQHMTSRFTSHDANGDGLLSQDEMIAGAQVRAESRVARMIEMFDKDGDGALSVAELPKPRNPGRMFEKIDADGSGGISAEEYAKLEERRTSRFKDHMKRRFNKN